MRRYDLPDSTRGLSGHARWTLALYILAVLAGAVLLYGAAYLLR